MSLTKIVTSEQMGQIEQRSEQSGVSTDALMEHAGLAVAQRVSHYLEPLKDEPVVVLVGPGNNGGDGLVTARHLHDWGAAVTVYICLNRRAPDPNLDRVHGLKIPLLAASDDDGCAKLQDLLGETRMVVDSVLGTGRARPIGGDLKAVLEQVTKAQNQRPDMMVLSVDLPTGLDADSGAADPVCLTADVTVTLGHPKVGLFAPSATEKTGTLEIVDIGIPPGLDDDVGLELMSPEWAASVLPDRPDSAHKGSFGKTLIVAGSRNYVGAAYLAAAAATRVGAGLVTLAIPESLQMAVTAKAVEPIYLPLPELSPGVVSYEAISIIRENLTGCDALLLGCGIGQATTTWEMVEELLYSGVERPPTVVDADALNILSASGTKSDVDEQQPWWERFISPAIVTPHPGEMARLTGEPTGKVQQDRTGIALESAPKWNKVTVLKGAHTVVASPDGTAMVSPFANPGLASGGTGDVLAGAIVGLLAQSATLEDAASLGVYLHGAAGERVREDMGDTGMIASDLLVELPRAIRAIREGISV